MGGALRKTMLYLGLADDQGESEEYLDEYEELEAPVRDRDDYQAQVTPLHRGGASESVIASDLRRITTIHPRSYNDARTIGEAFRGGTPVIMNLSDMDDADAKRLVDFSAGLIFGLRGSIDRVATRVFLLTPAHTEIVSGESQAHQRDGFFNQS